MSTSVAGLSTNFFPSPQNGFTTTLASTVSAGATTVPLNSVAGFANGDIAVLVVDPANASKQTFTGVVDTAGVQLTSVVWTAGTNVSHLQGATVTDYATATHIAMMAKGVLIAHDQAGVHKTGATYASPVFSGTATGTYTLAGTPTIASPTISGTSTITAASGNHLSLAAATGKLVKTSALRQDNITNTYELGNTVILTGWGFIRSLNGTTYLSKTVTFGVTFLNPPIVVIARNGILVNASDATNINQFTSDSTQTTGITSITTTGFNARVQDAAIGTTAQFGFTWMATGEL